MLSLAPDQEAQVRHVVSAVQECENRQHLRFRERTERLYARYRGYKDFFERWRSLNPGDRNRFLRDEDNGFGPPLTIPYAFATVESVLPRMLSNRPRMLVLPRGPNSEAAARNMGYLLDAQQEDIQYELVLQDIAKDGLITGLGVQKTCWRTKKQRRQLLAAGTYHPLIVTEAEITDFDGPVAERVDPVDFFGDAYASDMTSPAGRLMEWGVHRTWRSNRYVLDRMKNGLWNPLDPKDVESLSSKQRYEEIQAAKSQAAGTDSDAGSWGGIHEVLEFHDGDRMITVLDRQWLLVDIPNPYWHGELPFQLYRPTKVPGELYGIGEIEPIEDLCAEMDELRTNRRDNQRLAIQQVFAYDEGQVDAADIKFGPGKLLATNGDPRELLMPIPVRPLDGAGYQEEAALVANIDRVSGVSDVTSGADSNVQQTATGAQLVNAAASVRIQNKTRRLEAETIKPGARQFIALNQQMIRTNKTIRLPAQPSLENPNSRWQWYEIPPLELQGQMEAEPEGGATAPDNTPQKRADAQAKMVFLQDPMIDRRPMLLSILDDMGIKQPETYLAPPTPTVDPRTIDALAAVFGKDQVSRVVSYVQGALQGQPA